MRAAVTHGPGDIRLEEVPDPEPGEGEAVLRVEAVGLCGTDLHMFLGERGDTGFPLRQGHEVSGTVTALPAEYDGPLRVGDLVAMDPSIPCGACPACRHGDWPHCLTFEAIGVARPGGLADYVVAPVGQLHLATGLTPEQAALVEPFSIAEMALHRAQLRGDDRVLVTGAGPIGLALTLCAAVRGVPTLVSDPVPERRDLARALGAEQVVDPAQARDAVADWTGGLGADVAFEVSGARPALDVCVAGVGHGGRVVVVGLATHELTIPVPRLLFDGVTVLGSRAGLFERALRTVRSAPSLANRLVSRRFPLDEVEAALSYAIAEPASAIKVIVTGATG